MSGGGPEPIWCGIFSNDIIEIWYIATGYEEGANEILLKSVLPFEIESPEESDVFDFSDKEYILNLLYCSTTYFKPALNVKIENTYDYYSFTYSEYIDDDSSVVFTNDKADFDVVICDEGGSFIMKKVDKESSSAGVKVYNLSVVGKEDNSFENSGDAALLVSDAINNVFHAVKLKGAKGSGDILPFKSFDGPDPSGYYYCFYENHYYSVSMRITAAGSYSYITVSRLPNFSYDHYYKATSDSSSSYSFGGMLTAHTYLDFSAFSDNTELDLSYYSTPLDSNYRIGNPEMCVYDVLVRCTESVCAPTLKVFDTAPNGYTPKFNNNVMFIGDTFFLGYVKYTIYTDGYSYYAIKEYPQYLDS